MSPVPRSVATDAPVTRVPSPFESRSFVLLVTYTAPMARIDELLDEHRAWLDQFFADGTFLVSGP